MRISFLHLSDFHLNDSKGIHPAKIQAIVDSLGVYAPFEGIVIVLSGDIAATGQTNQYKIAATLLKRLVPQLKIKYSLNQKNIKILNHGWILQKSVLSTRTKEIYIFSRS